MAVEHARGGRPARRALIALVATSLVVGAGALGAPGAGAAAVNPVASAQTLSPGWSGTLWGTQTDTVVDGNSTQTTTLGQWLAVDGSTEPDYGTMTQSYHVVHTYPFDDGTCTVHIDSSGSSTARLQFNQWGANQFRIGFIDNPVFHYIYTYGGSCAGDPDDMTQEGIVGTIVDECGSHVTIGDYVSGPKDPPAYPAGYDGSLLYGSVPCVTTTGAHTLNWSLTKLPDVDHDGRPDTSDGCADTPPGTAVDASGCPIDPNHAPVANDDTSTVGVGASVAIPVLSNDTDADGDPLSIGTFTQPACGTVSIAIGPPPRLLYTAPADGCSGVVTFTYTASDGMTDSNSGAVTLTVSCPAGGAAADVHCSEVGALHVKVVADSPTTVLDLFLVSGALIGPVQAGGTLSGSFAPGTYVETLAVPPGWFVSSVSCSGAATGDVSARTGTFVITAGSSDTCTFHVVAGTLVAMGDSFSSGEGACQPGSWGSSIVHWGLPGQGGVGCNYIAPSDTAPDACHRSWNSWEAINDLTERYQFDPAQDFIACSGAKAHNFYDSVGEAGDAPFNEGEQQFKLAALAQAPNRVAAVTMTIGGNDLGFAPIVAACVSHHLQLVASCESQYGAAVSSQLTNPADPKYLPGILEARYRAVLANAPDAQVYVLGYPRAFAKAPVDRTFVTGGIGIVGPTVKTHGTCDFTTSDALWFNQVEARGDNAIQALIKQIDDPRLHYVDDYNAFDGHELCRNVDKLSSDSYMNPVRISLRDTNLSKSPVKPHPESFHPDRLGHAALAAALNSCVARTDAGQPCAEASAPLSAFGVSASTSASVRSVGAAAPASVHSPAVQSGGSVSATGGESFVDTNGDVADPRADITIASATSSATRFYFSIHVKAPTNPASDAGWQDSSGPAWTLDVNHDGIIDLVAVVFTLPGGKLTSVLLSADEYVPLCSGTAAYTATDDYTASFANSCLPAGTSFQWGAVMSYSAGGTATVITDYAPDGTTLGPKVTLPSTTHTRGAHRSGYWMLGADGVVYSFGQAAHSAGSVPGATAMTPRTDGSGYWVVDRSGGVHPYGTATFHGDRPALGAAEFVATMSATPRGDGYWLFTNRGRAFAYGAAKSCGDMTGVSLNGPIVASVATPTGKGYFMVGSDGGIFSFGDARFHGSMGAAHLNRPVVGIAPTPDNTGYWLVASDGGVFAFHAPFRGSLGGTTLNRPVNGLVAFGNGYLMAASDGGVFDYSNKPFQGSLGAHPPSAPIVGLAAFAR